jgi:histidyl-tRNA synthetase
VEINSIGCPVCRPGYHTRLKDFLAGKIDAMCSTCRERFDRNPLRVLDCKEEQCRKLTVDAPSMLDLLCDECRDHFEKLKTCLDSTGIPYRVNSRIVRGLDYYTKTVFEIVTETEAGKLTVCGGGRYDNLVSQIGGQDIPAVGFGMGLERVLMLMDAEKLEIPKPVWYDVFVTFMGKHQIPAFDLVRRFRMAGIRADLDHCGRSLKAQFKYANKTGAPLTAVIGDDEAAAGSVKIKRMNDGTEMTVSYEDACDTVLRMMNEEGEA